MKRIPWGVPAMWLAVLATLAAAGCGGEEREHRERSHEHDHAPGEERPAAGGEHHDEGDGHHGEGEEHDAVELTPEAIARVGLETEPATLRQVGDGRAATGTVGFDEDRLAHVSPRVGGRLVEIAAELGEAVAGGEVLAVLDSMDLGTARADYLRSRARHEVARQRFERERSLLADRIASEQEVLEAEAGAREAAADLAAAREMLRLLGLSSRDLEELSWEDASPSRIAVRSPFRGKVVTREATLGELVDPEHTLFTIADLARVWVWVDLYERDLAHVRLGEPVEVRFDAWPGEAATGELSYLADQLDPATRTLRARVDLPNPDGRFKPGMFARVTLAGHRDQGPPPVLAVPRRALQRDGDRDFVFVRVAPARFERRQVEVGRISGELAEVVTGLEAGERVVTEGAFLLKSQSSADQLGGHHH